MMTEFQRDLAAACQELDAARQELLGVVTALSDGNLDRAHRGGWTVRRVLEHVIQSEWSYARLVAHLRELPAAPGEMTSAAPVSVSEVVRALDASRQALLAALNGVDQESFYRTRAVGQEKHSALSALENAANHDREHAEQVRAIVSVNG